MSDIGLAGSLFTFGLTALVDHTHPGEIEQEGATTLVTAAGNLPDRERRTLAAALSLGLADNSIVPASTIGAEYKQASLATLRAFIGATIGNPNATSTGDVEADAAARLILVTNLVRTRAEDTLRTLNQNLDTLTEMHRDPSLTLDQVQAFQSALAGANPDQRQKMIDSVIDSAPGRGISLFGRPAPLKAWPARSTAALDLLKTLVTP